SDGLRANSPLCWGSYIRVSLKAGRQCGTVALGLIQAVASAGNRGNVPATTACTGGAWGALGSPNSSKCRKMKLFPPNVLAAVLSMCAAPAAHALAPTVRYAATGSTNTVGSCPQNDPCRIDYAINSAPASAEVIVLPGTYDVSALPTLAPAATSLNIHGAP